MENAKTIAQLLDAAPLSDDDYLVINQPNVLDPITQQPGTTRRVKVKDVKFHNRIIGAHFFMGHYPSLQQLAQWRLLVLNYQIILISDYQDLCDLLWVGAGANNTADWWYKCDADGTRNENGLYMRVEDGRGMFYRGAGANAIKTGANNTPYDGNSIGTFVADAIRDISGSVRSWVGNIFHNLNGCFSVFMESHTHTIAYYDCVAQELCSGFNFNPSLVVPTANENRPVSISALICMSY